MALKKDEIANPKSCLNKAADDEPVFVLRAKDVLGPVGVEAWANEAERLGIHEPEKIEEARALAADMRRWRSEHFPILTGFTEPREDDEMPLLECES